VIVRNRVYVRGMNEGIEHCAPKPGQLVLPFAVIGASVIAGHAFFSRMRGPKPA